MSSVQARAWRVGIGALSLMSWVSVAQAAEPLTGPPLTLQQAIAAALKRNPELGTFSFQLQAQQARERQAGLRPAPELGVEVENFAGTGDTKGFDAAEATLALSQVIELGGKRQARIDAARAGIDVLAIDRQAAQLDVLAEVTRRFIAVAQDQALADLARTGTALAKNTVDASEKRVNVAKSPHVELDRARIALTRAELDESQALYRLEASRQSLAATWGENRAVLDGRPVRGVQADLFALPDPGEFPALMQRVAANPDFLRFTSEARLRDAELRLAATQRRPDVAVGGGVRRLEESGDTAFVASVSIPLFAGRRVESFVAEAQANRDLLNAERQVALVKAQAQLFKLHQELRHAVLEARTLQQDTQPRMAEALKETQYAFDRGRYSYLELVDARREYLDIQRSLIEAAAEAHTLRTEIERLTNAPLTTDASPTPADRNNP